MRVNKHCLRFHIRFTAVIEETSDVATLARVDNEQRRLVGVLEVCTLKTQLQTMFLYSKHSEIALHRFRFVCRHSLAIDWRRRAVVHNRVHAYCSACTASSMTFC